MRRYAVIGCPARHSLSPWLHKQFARITSRPIVYAAYAPTVDEFNECVNEFFTSGGRGLNITLPYKQKALTISETASALAKRIDAANVLTFDDGKLAAFSTDGAGLVKDITVNCGVSLKNRRVLLIGAGGAARAAAAAMAQQYIELIITARKIESAQELAQLTATQAVEINHCDGGFDIIINATSSGHKGQAPQLPPQVYEGAQLAYDLNYGKAALPFLQAAAAAKCRVDGVGMLVEQAALSFAIWEKVMPSTAALVKFLRARQSDY